MDVGRSGDRWRVLNIPKDTIEDWLCTLIVQNAERIEYVSPTPTVEGYFKNHTIAVFLSWMCDVLKLNLEVKLIAQELIEKFMTIHLEDLYSYVSRSSKNLKKDWGTVEDKIANQVQLRVLSCIQIASKLENGYESLSNEKIRSVLAKLGHLFGWDAITRSELRVLRTLDYSVSVTTPLTYVETLIALLGNGDPQLTSQNETCMSLCEKELEFLMLYGDRVYDRLFAKTGVPPRGAHGILAVKADYILLATGVILMAFFIMGGEDIGNKVKFRLHSLTKVKPDDMTDFAVCLFTEFCQQYQEYEIQKKSVIQPVLDLSSEN